ncbi:MAG: acyl-CoA dehydratase activase [Desulfobulbaceae bacterium]|nr:acyl-CoA dehydratase activase [Desulfobulbaceae bacterium]
MITAGIDIGSVAAKAVLFDHDTGRVLARRSQPSGYDHAETVRDLLAATATKAGIESGTITALGATGYGRMAAKNTPAFTGKSAARVVSEIRCHAKGAHFLCPEVNAVIDIGGQDSKAIRLDAQGEVADFVMNDKCAAGTGRFLLMAATILEMDLPSFSQAAASGEAIAINSMCAVFAESEIVSLIARRVRREHIAAGIIESIAQRAASLARRLDTRGLFAFSGGLATSQTMANRLAAALGGKLTVPEQPQFCGALGAALLAAEGQ